MLEKEATKPAAGRVSVGQVGVLVGGAPFLAARPRQCRARRVSVTTLRPTRLTDARALYQAQLHQSLCYTLPLQKPVTTVILSDT